MVINFASKSVRLILPCTLSSSPFSSKPASLISSSLLTTCTRRKPPLIFQNRVTNSGFGLCNSRGNNLKRFCSIEFDEFPEEELCKMIEGLAENFDVIDDEEEDKDKDKDTGNARTEVSCNARKKKHENDQKVKISAEFMPSQFEFLEHNLLGIHPEAEHWPERDEINRVNIEKKANCLGIPLSLKMIKRKQKWQQGFGDAGDFAHCSVKKAFSSLVYIIRELQNYALRIRENLYSEDLKEIMSKVQREMNISFVWLYQKVFSRTPTLMVYVMILLANFTVHSMSDHTVVAATSLSFSSCKTISEAEIDKQLEDSNSDVGNNGGGKIVRPTVDGTEGGDWHMRRSSPFVEQRRILPEVNHEMTEEEAELWNSMVEEASRMQEESRLEILHSETKKFFVTPITMRLEPEDYVDYFRTDLLYQMGVAEEPSNSLLLGNYAQLLHLVAQDYDRAEECYKRAVQVEPPDAEALSRFADFLWTVRKDLWGAEERYLQALAADPSNAYHASKYATFLWSTGGADTCFPLTN
ncbi:uncharacterized protein LOC123192415 [Mangifera indica]|uniref:uncharacterized protein LOC123192415 n=1 Tax=Mangifera indica TaxID=29780 RepID=UPI001CFB4DC6|nr:uncharacterized protein LOC123192415 [Mangifera indica]XP_044460891.1 uncharacterized protein LOC123192415 [Mangifera indica]